MKQKLLTIKSLLVVALMLVGASNVWAGTTTLLDIDYSTTTTPAWTVVGGTGNITDGKWVHAQANGSGNRSAYLDFGVASSIDDNWTVEFDLALKPGSDRNDQQVAVTGANTTYANNTSATGYMYFAVKEEANGGTSYTVKIGNADVATGVTLSNGTTYHIIVTYDGSSAVTAKIGETQYNGTVAIANVGKLRGLHSCVARYDGAATFDNILVTKEVTAEEVSAPSIAVAYVGANRTVTITPGVSSESNVVTTYYTINGDDPTSSDDVYSTPLDIDADCTVKAISISSSSVSSAIASQAITVGKLKLVAPTITKTAYAAGKYTVNMTSDQSGLAYPPASYTTYYSIDGGAAKTYSAPFELTAGSTVTGYVTATNYTNSDEVNLTSTARPTYYAVEWTQDYTNITSASGNGAYGVVLNGSADFTVDDTEMKNIIGYTFSENTVPVSLNTNVGLSTSTNFNLRCNGGNSGILKNGGTGYLGIQNLKVGDVIVITTSGSFLNASYGVTLNEGMCTNTEYYFTATATKVSIGVSAGVYNYIKSITVYSPTVSATIGTTGYTTFASPYALNLSGMTASEGTVKAYYVTASDVKSSSVALTDATGNVAAETGLILEGTANATITIPVVASGAALSGNKLVGCTTATDITSATENYGNFYVLSATEAAFKKIKTWVDAPNTLTIPAGKAYLDTTGADVVGAPTLTFDLGGVTAITNTNCTNNTNIREVYNLNGQRVAQPTKGLYIVNGKKIIIK